MDEPSPYYLGVVVDSFLDNAQHLVGPTEAGGRYRIPQTISSTHQMLDPFVNRFYPVLQHYLPEIVGRCLAFAYDFPDSYRSETVGFGVYMRAGNHRSDRDSQLGSYRDDGSYLALQAHDFFAQVYR